MLTQPTYIDAHPHSIFSIWTHYSHYACLIQFFSSPVSESQLFGSSVTLQLTLAAVVGDAHPACIVVVLQRLHLHSYEFIFINCR